MIVSSLPDKGSIWKGVAGSPYAGREYVVRSSSQRVPSYIPTTLLIIEAEPLDALGDSSSVITVPPFAWDELFEDTGERLVAGQRVENPFDKKGNQ